MGEPEASERGGSEKEHGRGPRRRDPQWTHRVLLDALLSLMSEGQRSPTGKAIAERAGVSERTMFVHFPDREALYRAAALHQAERWKACAEPVPPRWPTARKVGGLLAQRERMYTLMTPIRVVGLGLEAESPGLRQVMAEGDAWFRADLAEIFTPELSLHSGAADPGGVLDALDAAASWAAWNHLRVRRGLSAKQTRQAITRTLSAVLAPPV